MVHVNTGALTELFSCGKTSTPVIVRLSSSELLLSKENVGIFIGPDGKPSRKVPPQNVSLCHSGSRMVAISAAEAAVPWSCNLRTPDNHGNSLFPSDHASMQRPSSLDAGEDVMPHYHCNCLSVETRIWMPGRREGTLCRWA